MKLVTFEPLEQAMKFTRVGAIFGEKYIIDLNFAYASYLSRVKKELKPHELASVYLPPDMLSIVSSWEPSYEAAKRTLEYIDGLKDNVVGIAGERILYTIDDVKIKTPIARPGKILAAGRNYAKHIKEASKAKGETWEVAPFPRGFVKVTSIIIGPDDPVIKPRVTNELSYELELALVISKRAKYISKDAAYEYIAGYIICNDMSARDIQKEEMKFGNHMLGKNLDTFAPMGPYLVTKDEVKDPMALQCELRVNDVVRQDFNTSDMINNIPEILERWSWVTLEPGDFIWTGTGEGTPTSPETCLQDGDVIEGRIDGLGILKNKIQVEQD